MSVLELKEIRAERKENFFKFLVIISTIVLPSILIAFGVFLFFRDGLSKPPISSLEIKTTDGVITPSQLLEKRSYYLHRQVVLQGRVSEPPMVCEQLECSADDPCCGCPKGKGLAVSDPDEILVQKSSGQLMILDAGKTAPCQRQPGSCQYDCPDWKVGSVYEMSGAFFGEPPPAGTTWQFFTDAYFQVEEKRLVKTFTLMEMPQRWLTGLKELFGKNFRSGYYMSR